MKIRNSYESDQSEIENIHTTAFGQEKGPEIAELVIGLFADKSAAPVRSLVAVKENRCIGHVLFTKVTVVQSPVPVTARILAPLAVLPQYQGTGVGGRLIEKGLSQLKQSGVDLVFVLGHPGYYTRSGFTPAGKLGFEAPYPIPKVHADAWMVIELTAGILGRARGTVKCSDVLNQPRHWRE